MGKGEHLVKGRWRIVETGVWDQEDLDLVVPAHITFEHNGLGEMQLIAIGASIDYRVEKQDGVPIVEFSWSGFDEMDPSTGRGRATIEGNTMRGKLFIHHGDESSFVAKRAGSKSGANKSLHRPRSRVTPLAEQGSRRGARR